MKHLRANACSMTAAAGPFGIVICDWMPGLQTVGLFAAALFCVVVPIEDTQLLILLSGAAAFALLQPRPGPSQFTAKKVPARCRETMPSTVRSHVHAGGWPSSLPTQLARSSRLGQKNIGGPDPIVQQITVSVAPVTAPTFLGKGFDAEVVELLAQISPTSEGEAGLMKLSGVVDRALRSLFPDIEINGFASGSITGGKAYGVAVPEVDIVATVSQTALLHYLQLHTEQRGRNLQTKVDAEKLERAALRACMDCLVAVAGFKFRRTAFCGDEPRVTLSAPSSLGIYGEMIPFDFSINAVTPLYNAAVLAECGRLERRAMLLILLVRRWAKDRSVCVKAPRIAHSHLSPYAWTLLAIYFLQVGLDDEIPLLPPLEGFTQSLGIDSPPSNGTSALDSDRKAPQSVSVLFKAFMRFYAARFDWRNEAVCVLSGMRSAPPLSLPIKIVTEDDGSKPTPVPSVEDPFKIVRNLGEVMSAVSLARLHEEFARANDLCARDASLTELLEPWVPAGAESSELDSKVPRENDVADSNSKDAEGGTEVLCAATTAKATLLQSKLSGGDSRPWRRRCPGA